MIRYFIVLFGLLSLWGTCLASPSVDISTYSLYAEESESGNDSLRFLRQSLNEATPAQKASIYYSIARLFENKQAPNDSARIYFLKSYLTSRDNQLDFQRKLAAFELGRILYGKDQLTKARPFLIDAEEGSAQQFDVQQRLLLYKQLITIDKSQNRLRTQIGWYEKYLPLWEGLVNENHKNELAEIRKELSEVENQAKEEVNQASQSLSQARSKHNQRNYMWLTGGGIIILLLVFALLYFIRRSGVFSKKFQQLKKRFDQLEVSLKKIFAVLANDLRAPIDRLKNQSDINVQQAEGNQADPKMQGELEQLNHSLDNVLKWAMTETKEIPYSPAQIRIKPVLDEVTRLQSGMLASKNLRFRITLHEDQRVWADPQALFFILRNILNNAAKFSYQDASISIGSKIQGENLVLIIEDKGKGMNEEQLKNALEKDESPQRQGTSGEMGNGLGMWLVKEFLTTNKGDIEISSRPGKGTKIQLFLPRS